MSGRRSFSCLIAAQTVTDSGPFLSNPNEMNRASYNESPPYPFSTLHADVPRKYSTTFHFEFKLLSLILPS